ncbi:MAG TPA: hypothetical protein VMJ93_09780 [Verrucomicrobiae bacterium]|nr:hypothetical protein [Verrucomicrobiae bacterium]
MRFLVTFALANEFAPWRTAEKFEEQGPDSPGDIFRAEIGGAEITVLLTGVGPRRASRAVTRLLREGERFDALVSSGLAGSLRTGIEVGQVVAGRGVTCEPLQPNARGGSLAASRPLIEFADSCSALLVDRFYTAGHVVASAEEKRVLGELADVVEMESFDVLLAGKEEGIPGIGIRAISDRSDEDLPLDMTALLDEDGRVSYARVVGQAMMHPQAVPGLMKLGQQSKRAAEELAGFLSRYVEHIAVRMNALEEGGPAGTRRAAIAR